MHSLPLEILTLRFAFLRAVVALTELALPGPAIPNLDSEKIQIRKKMEYANVFSPLPEYDSDFCISVSSFKPKALSFRSFLSIYRDVYLRLHDSFTFGFEF